MALYTSVGADIILGLGLGFIKNFGSIWPLHKVSGR